MANKRQAQLLLNHWQQKLDLMHWEITFAFDKPTVDKKAVASCHKNLNYDVAEIRLNDNWRKWSDEELERTLVHELLHCLFNQMEGTLWKLAEDDSFKEQVGEQVLEHLVEKLAKVLTGHIGAHGLPFADERREDNEEDE